MKTLFALFTALLLAAAAAPALAQNHAGHGATSAPSAPSAATAAGTASEVALTAGEITRVDARTGKLTIRHGDIQHLNMPAMTMVFALQDSSQAASYQPGDKVLFDVRDQQGTLTITRIQRAP